MLRFIGTCRITYHGLCADAVPGGVYADVDVSCSGSASDFVACALTDEDPPYVVVEQTRTPRDVLPFLQSHPVVLDAAVIYYFARLFAMGATTAEIEGLYRMQTNDVLSPADAVIVASR